MRNHSRKLRPFLGLALSALLIATCVGEPRPAAAQILVPPAPPAPPSQPSRGGGLNGSEVVIGIGIAIGIAILGIVIKQLTTPPPPPDGVLEQPPGPVGGNTFYEGGDRGGSGHERGVRVTRGFRTGGNVPGSGTPGGNNPGGGTPRRSERHFVPDEVITEFSSDATAQTINQLALRYALTQLESQAFPLIGATFYRWRIGAGRSVLNTVRTLRRERIVASVQPNYLFFGQEQVAQASSAPPSGDAAQYVLAKLEIAEAHRIATGKNVLVAVIDSELDVKHPDLSGTIVQSFDALGGDQNPHEHGTAMAGAIASHGKLLGIAPDARILAARAFDDSPGSAKGTSFAIYKGLQWAADNGARIVNMSFAGPADPDLHRMLTAAFDKGMVLIAAAGNAGPNSPPLYPAADPDVIAVTATDSNDHVFKMANRGRYVAVAAPGVQILALAPEDSYRTTTGTSVAAAHVTGVVALLLERKPTLKPSDVRSILMTTARPLGSKAEFGAGLVDAYRALLSLNSVGSNDLGAHTRR